LAGALRPIKHRLPPKVWAQVERHSLVAGARALYLARELARIYTMLEGQGIRILAWRGVVAACDLHGRLDAREFDDIDLLVNPDDISRIRDCLERDGYTWPLGLTPPQEQRYRHSVGEYIFWPAGREYQVEVNTGLGPRYFGWPVDFDLLWARRRTVVIEGAQIPTLAREDLLVFLCVHAAKHQWRRMQWVVDIAALVRDTRVMDRGRVMECARRLDAEGVLAAGLRLDSELFGARPQFAAPGAAGSKRHDVLYAVGRKQLLADRDRPCSMREALRYHRAMHDRWGARMALIIRMAVTPSVGDWYWTRLPARLFALYYILRPVRLMTQWMGGRFNRPDRDAAR